METTGPSFTKLFRGTKFVNAMERHSAANFERQIHVVNRFVNLAPELMNGRKTCKFTSFSTVSQSYQSGNFADYERLYVMKPCLRLERLPPRAVNLLSTGASDCRS